MKKKHIFKTFAIGLAIFGMTALASCTTSNPYANDPRYPIYELALADGFIGTYQQWLETIKGADGENGQTPHIGENGNWWIGDTDTGVPATGPQGPAGSDGQPGSQGEPGKDGADGQDGKDGVDGQDGKDGTTPHIGDNGNWWIGDQDTGIPATGNDGQDGADGKDGVDGKDGTDGKDGADGTDGKDGLDGTDGVDGKDGTSVLTGSGVPSNGLGQNGDSYIDLDTWDFYVKVDGSWIYKGNIKGEDANKEVHTITFDTNGGTDVEIQYVQHGEKIKKPANPTKLGAEFVCWEYMGEPWVFHGYVVTEDMTLTAVWNDLEYTITFVNDDNSVLDYQTGLHYGDAVVYNGLTPEKVNTENHYVYTFAGWDKELVVTGDMTFTAQYNAEYAPFTTIFQNYDGSELYRTLVKEGETATYVGDTPTRPDDGDTQYLFKEWKEISNDGETIIYQAMYDGCTKGLIFEGNEVYQYIGTSKIVYVPSVWDGYTITTISDRAFENTSITEVYLPDSVTSIGKRAFYYCTSLTSINIPNSVTSIGVGVFEHCTSLASVTLGNRVTYIEYYAFRDCSSLTSIVIPDSVTSIGSYAFEYCSSLTSIVIPDSVTSISERAFSSCTSLTSINIPNSVTSIGSSAFSSCTSLTSIVIPDSVTSIEVCAFYNCTSLTIYCEHEYEPKGWETNWNLSCMPVYWAGEWEYDENGNPIVITPEDPTPSDPIEGVEEVLNKAIENTINAKNGTLHAVAEMTMDGQTMTRSMSFYTDGTKAAMEMNGEIEVNNGQYTLGCQIIELALAGSFKYSEINENEDDSYHIEQLTCVLSVAKYIELRNFEDINITFTNDGYEFILSDVDLSLNGGYIHSISYTCGSLGVRGHSNDDVNWEYSFYENSDMRPHFTYTFSDIGTTVVPEATTPDVDEPETQEDAEKTILSALEKTVFAKNGTMDISISSEEISNSMSIKVADQKAEAYGSVLDGVSSIATFAVDMAMGTNHKFENLVDKGDGYYHADAIIMNLDANRFIEEQGYSLDEIKSITNNNIEYEIKNVSIQIKDGYIVSLDYDVDQTPYITFTHDAASEGEPYINVTLGMTDITNGHMSYRFYDIGTTVIEGSSTPSEE